MDPVDVVVLGADCVGAAVAWELAAGGLSVALVDREQVGAHAGTTHAALLDAHAAQDLESALRPRAREALERLREVVDELDFDLTGDPGLAESGVLRVLSASEADVADARDRPPEGAEWVDRGDLGPLGARLAENLVGGFLFAEDALVDPARLARALAAAAVAEGAVVRPDAPAAGIAMAQGCAAGVLLADDEVVAAGEVVLCLGARSAQMEALLGCAIPLDVTWTPTVAVAVATAAAGPALCRGDVRLVATPHAALRAGDAGLRIEPGAPAGVAIAEELRAAAAGILPELASALMSSPGAEAIDRTRDGLPLVGRLPGLEGVSIAAGYGRHAALFSAQAAEHIAHLLVRGEVPQDAEPFSPDRFAGTDSPK